MDKNMGFTGMDLPTDGVSDWSLDKFRGHYRDNKITKDDIWYYLYGVMHAPDWRQRYKVDLKRSFPRIPFAPDFWAFSKAGATLMQLHLNYETGPEYPLAIETISDSKKHD